VQPSGVRQMQEASIWMTELLHRGLWPFGVCDQGSGSPVDHEEVVSTLARQPQAEAFDAHLEVDYCRMYPSRSDDR
jgi:hypothetical protein